MARSKGKKKTRVRIPPALASKVLYDSQYKCAVCHEPAVHIHHIDDDPSNNSEENLICVCANHHGEAHTKRELAQNLTAERLKDARETWTKLVREHRIASASVSGQLGRVGPTSFMSVGITWGYINHRRVIEMIDVGKLSGRARERFNDCKVLGIVDKQGIPIKPSTATMAESYVGNSIYDWFEQTDGWRLHALYVALVDRLSEQIQPVHLEREWLDVDRTKELVKSGTPVFIQAPFYFKAVSESQENEHRRVHVTINSVKLEFEVDTRDMYGTTSMTVSFFGRQTCAAFLLVKSVKQVSGKLLLDCTPIALGVSFQRY